jgi:CRP-like cAMP-binding protein
MNASLVLDNVCKHIVLNDDERNIFLSLLESSTVKRRALHLREGEVCHYSTFVVEGALKGYTVDATGNEHVLNFALPDWWIADMYSLISQKPGVLNIEALVDTKVLLLSRENQETLFTKVPKFERFFRILVENALVASQQRLINNLSLTAEERYLQFSQKYPAILECAPLHSIASYLGITPEFLSKIRSRLARRAE